MNVTQYIIEDTIVVKNNTQNILSKEIYNYTAVSIAFFPICLKIA